MLLVLPVLPVLPVLLAPTCAAAQEEERQRNSNQIRKVHKGGAEGYRKIQSGGYRKIQRGGYRKGGANEFGQTKSKLQPSIAA